MCRDSTSRAFRCRSNGMSWQNVLLTWALRRWIKPSSQRDPDVAAMRARSARVPFGAKILPGWQVSATRLRPLDGEWVRPVAPNHPARTRCILYLHGGGYVAMSPRTHRSLTSRLAIWSDTSLFALDYRLAPEYPFPAALEDAVAAFRALVTGGNSPSQIVVAGDSAGGGLALALLIALRDLGERLPAGAVLFSPWTDLAATGQSVIDNNERDALFYGSWMTSLASHYLGTTPATDPLASPLYADLTGLPPLALQASTTEILLDDSRRVTARALQAGVPARLQLWPNTPHGWQVFAPILPEGRSALRDAAAFIRARLT
jgi:epsilon-lactone hydrolase